jgi:hypothetical protein
MARTMERYGTLGKKLPRRGRRRVKYEATPCDQNHNAHMVAIELRPNDLASPRILASD